MKFRRVLSLITAFFLLCGMNSFGYADSEKEAGTEPSEPYIRDGAFTFTPEEFCEIFVAKGTSYLNHPYVDQSDLVLNAAMEEGGTGVVTFNSKPVCTLLFYPESIEGKGLGNPLSGDQHGTALIVFAFDRPDESYERISEQTRVQHMALYALNPDYDLSDVSDLSVEISNSYFDKLPVSGGGMTYYLYYDGELKLFTVCAGESADMDVTDGGGNFGSAGAQ